MFTLCAWEHDTEQDTLNEMLFGGNGGAKKGKAGMKSKDESSRGPIKSNLPTNARPKTTEDREPNTGSARKLLQKRKKGEKRKIRELSQLSEALTSNKKRKRTFELKDLDVIKTNDNSINSNITPRSSDEDCHRTKRFKTKSIGEDYKFKCWPTGSDSSQSRPSHSEVSKTKNSLKTGNKHAPFRHKLKQKLDGAQFRWINEKLYTTDSQEAIFMFSSNESLFDVYHRGFQSQVNSWPENPVDIIIKHLQNSPSTLIVADFGCGEAKIAQNIKQNIHSFDLVARNEFVTASDMAHTPLEDASIDVAVFCLSLMGTNLEDFLREAYRVLKPRGTMKIAEVVSRFDDLEDFIGKDTTNKMFVLMDFRKSTKKRPKSNISISLKPCIYKRR